MIYVLFSVVLSFGYVLKFGFVRLVMVIICLLGVGFRGLGYKFLVCLGGNNVN